NLIVRSADAAGADLETRTRVRHGLLEDLDGIVLRALRDDLERAEHDVLCDRLLAVVHHAIDELGDLPVHIGGVVGVADFKDRTRAAGDVLAGHRTSSSDGLLRPFGAVLRATLTATLDTRRIQRSTHDVVADTGEVLDAATADQDHRVFLQVVSLAGNVARDFHPVGQADTGHFPQGRARLLRRAGVHANAHPTLLRALLEGRGGLLGDLPSTSHSDELLDGGHGVESPKRAYHGRGAAEYRQNDFRIN